MSEIDDVQKEMARIRLEMHHDIAGVVKDAESLFNWRSYITKSPWISVAAAFGLGYLIVPTRASRQHPVQPFVGNGLAPRDKPGNKTSRTEVSLWSIGGTALSLAAPIAIRAAQSYVLSWVEDRFLGGMEAKSKAAKSPQDDPFIPREAGSRRF